MRSGQGTGSDGMELYGSGNQWIVEDISLYYRPILGVQRNQNLRLHSIVGHGHSEINQHLHGFTTHGAGTEDMTLA